MLVTIDNQEYFLVTSENHGIRIDYDSDSTPTLYAHAHYTIDELAPLIRKFNKKQVNQPNSTNLEFIHIDLFQEKQPIKIIRNGIQKPFFKNKIAYVCASSKTNINHINFIEKIRQQLFEQHIIERISYWEDNLHVLSNKITFRILKSNDYHINKTTRNITFNRANIDLSYKENDHLVFQALTSLKT